MKKYFTNKSFIIGSILFSILITFLIVGFIFLPYDYNQIDTQNKFSNFSREHILGTDYLGRDIFSRIVIGMSISVGIGFTVMIFSLFFGTILGALSGFFGGTTDKIISKLTDTQMSFPGILLALMFIAIFDTSIKILIIALTIISIPRVTRIAKSGFLKYKNSLFVLNAKSKGASNFRILFYHILPNVIPDLIVTSTLNFSLSILSESGLSYLGLGIQPPLPSLGKMLSEGQRFILQNPSNIIITALFLILLVLSLNLIGDGISEVNQK